jgi:aspartate aminotransferase-like enzyme
VRKLVNRLYIPGPVDVNSKVLNQMSKPMISHREPEFSDILTEVTNKLQKLMVTKNNIFISTSSSTGLMEAAIRNCVDNRCLCVSNGAFGNRWYEIAVKNGKEADLLEVDWGKAVTIDLIEDKLNSKDYEAVTLIHNETSTGISNPIYDICPKLTKHDICILVDAVSSLGGIKVEVDKWGIDVCISASQKALGLPPGLSVCSVSEKSINKAKNNTNRGYYFDFLMFLKYWLDRKQTPTTPAISQIYALNYQLDRILYEGLEKRFSRHAKMGNLVRKWVKAKFEIFGDERYASNTLTCIKNTININIEDVIRRLRTKGYIISNGYGKLRERTFRIAHMGDRKLEEIEELLQTIDCVLTET